jgi:hypothetical protein
VPRVVVPKLARGFERGDTKGANRSQLDALLKNGIGVSALGLIRHKTPETLAKSVNGRRTIQDVA